MTRTHARSPVGQRAVCKTPHGHWKTISTIAAMTTRGMLAAASFDGATDTSTFITFVRDELVPQLKPDQIVVLDNLAPHRSPAVMPMLSPGHGKTKQGRMWIYLGDEDHPYNLFDFTLSRSRDGPVKFLGDYNQTLLADAYGGYDGVVVKSGITRAGCWAHARRKFVDAEKTQPLIAREAVAMIKGLYAIEDHARSVNSADRLHQRQSQSTPILQQLHHRLLAWKDQLLPKHPMAEAVNYALNQWNELNVFAADASVPIDNNASEREMKRIVLNRKNSLFVGNERGGETAAILASFTSTCKRHNIDPQHYLTQLLTNLPDTPISQLDQWLPDQCKKSQPPPPV